MGSDPTTASAEQMVHELLAWFDEHGRDWPWRTSRDRWIVLVCEVCSQQTQIARAAPFIERILDRFPTPGDLARAELGELLVLWQGLGYPRRARNLWLASQVIDADGWPDDLRALPGVGPYTDAAIRCFADEQPVVPPDINTRRVLARLFPDGAPTHEQLPILETRAWAWGSALMELGQTSCRARAACETCPVAASCPSAGTDEVIASPRQARYEGSMRQRRGVLLRAVAELGSALWDDDPVAAESLVADGLAARGGADDELLLPPDPNPEEP
jgi:A/G-specific adenine glycosylase